MQGGACTGVRVLPHVGQSWFTRGGGRGGPEQQAARRSAVTAGTGFQKPSRLNGGV